MVHVAAALDVDIQQDVLDELAWSQEVAPNEVGVEVDGGIVTLTGTVSSYAKKVAAEKAAQRVFGVRAVANDLVVRPEGSEIRDDTSIARAISNAFEWSALIPEERIQVAVSNGYVTLQGAVDFNFQRKEAERQVHQLFGIKGINNNITIIPPPLEDEYDIEDQIASAFRRRSELDAQNISVEIKGHTVVLHGTVQSPFEREEAERTAWGPGIYKVDNEIVVEKGE